MTTFPDDDKAVDKALAEVSSIEDEKMHHMLADGDSIIEGSEGVTQHEFDTLRHVADRLPLNAWLVVVVEFAERYVFFFLLAGLSINLLYADGHTMVLQTSSTTIFVLPYPGSRSMVPSLQRTVALVWLVR